MSTTTRMMMKRLVTKPVITITTSTRNSTHPPPTLQHIIADYAGSTAGPYGIETRLAMQQSLRKYGVHLSMEEISRLGTGMSKRDHLRATLRHAGKGDDATILDKLYETYIDTQWQLLVTTPWYMNPIPGVRKAFNEFRRGGRGRWITVDTGYPASIANLYRTHLEKHGVWFNAQVASDEVVRGRPDPESIDRLQRMHSIAQVGAYHNIGTAVLKCDDTLPGLQAGLEAKQMAWTCGLYGMSDSLAIDKPVAHYTREELRLRRLQLIQAYTGHGVHYAIFSLRDLNQVVKDINQRLQNGEAPFSPTPQKTRVFWQESDHV